MTRMIKARRDTGFAMLAEAQWLADWGRRNGVANIVLCTKVLDAVEHAGIAGLVRSNLKSGRPVFLLNNSILGSVKILQVAAAGAGIRDTMENDKKWGK